MTNTHTESAPAKANITHRLPPVHPGEILLHEFMQPLSLSAYRVSEDIDVTTSRVLGIIHGSRSITADTALRLSAYFGTSVQFWMNLQSNYDVETAAAAFEPVRKTIKPIKVSAVMPRTSKIVLSSGAAHMAAKKPAAKKVVKKAAKSAGPLTPVKIAAKKKTVKKSGSKISAQKHAHNRRATA